MTYTIEEQVANREKWIAALRSGEFLQAKGYLSVVGVGMCCLGVACDLASKNGIELVREDVALEREEIKPEYYDEPVTVERFGDDFEVLPTPVQEWLGLSSASADWSTTAGEMDGLAIRNDRGDTFEKIAAIIESEPEGLFVS